MGDNCTIEWVAALAKQRNAIPASLNPIRGCSRLSEACRNCYAAGIAHRFGHKGNGIWAGLTDLDPDGTPRFNGTLRWVPEVLTTAINAKRSRVYFVCDMSDLFHARVDQDWIDQVFAMMALCRHHHFLLLTKRPDRMRRYLTARETPYRINRCLYRLGGQSNRAGDQHFALKVLDESDKDRLPDWPLPNVWTGATVEDQAEADERVADLMLCPSVRRYLSVEPMLGPVDLTRIVLDECEATFLHDPRLTRARFTLNALTGAQSLRLPPLDWVICGGESGPKARPISRRWVRELQEQCTSAGRPFFFKQWGEWEPAGMCPAGTAGRFAFGDYDFDRTCFHQVEGYPRQFDMFGARAVMKRVGKKASGRLLDGRTWDEVPEVRP
ncbi:phage Gp37/Gp68 family protein (plasmid) [Azospirillum sp. HJ39]|uniref:phage Gp37/Gp68 family protein n=1 Tax=Azospirillum sp. HJ39 TaxID=3159496 RepID=UPI00355658F9